MRTKIVMIPPELVAEGNFEGTLQEAGNIIKQGGLVAFPTETVYGLGGDALNKESSKKIYEAKGRPSDNPLIVHICKWEDVLPLASYIPDTARLLADVFWPGPLTIILKKSDLVPLETTGGLDTVAVRMPDHPVALAFIEAAGGYVAAPSANTSGRPSPTLAEHVDEDLNGKIEMIIDGGLVGIGLESTIVDLTTEIPMILRPGFITEQMLLDVLEQVETDGTILDTNSTEVPKAPGMKYKHYAPIGELTIVDGESEQVIAKINEMVEEDRKLGHKVGIIATDETSSFYRADVVKSAGKRSEENTIARYLYGMLREFDKEEVTKIYSESFSSKGMGQAIMNRLLKAAAHNVLKI